MPGKGLRQRDSILHERQCGAMSHRVRHGVPQEQAFLTEDVPPVPKGEAVGAPTARGSRGPEKSLLPQGRAPRACGLLSREQVRSLRIQDLRAWDL
jgi:hypothetical protein